MAVVLHEYKGFCLDYTHKTDAPSPSVTTGIDTLPTYAFFDGEMPESPSQEGLKDDSKQETTAKKSKQQKRLEKQQKKIRTSQRKIKERSQHHHKDNGDEIEGNGRATAASIRNQIKTIYAQLSTNTETKLFQYESVAMYSTDLDQILPGEWVNDNIISLMYEYLNKNMIQKFQPFIKLISPAVVQLISFTDHEILDKKDFTSAKFIFLPVNETQEGDHWFLVLVNILENEVLVYDSMLEEGADNRALIDNLISRLTNNGIINPNKLMVKNMKIEQQSNFDDCGVYLIMISCYLVNMLLNKDINFNLSSLSFDSLKGRLDIMKVIRHLHHEMQPTEKP